MHEGIPRVETKCAEMEKRERERERNDELKFYVWKKVEGVVISGIIDQVKKVTFLTGKNTTLWKSR